MVGVRNGLKRYLDKKKEAAVFLGLKRYLDMKKEVAVFVGHVTFDLSLVLD